MHIGLVHPGIVSKQLQGLPNFWKRTSRGAESSETMETNHQSYTRNGFFFGIFLFGLNVQRLDFTFFAHKKY